MWNKPGRVYGGRTTVDKERAGDISGLNMIGDALNPETPSSRSRHRHRRRRRLLRRRRWRGKLARE